MVRWQRSEHVDPAALVGHDNAAMVEALAAIGARRNAGELPARFVDLHFSRLMADPVGVIRAAYEQMGRAFSDEHAEAIRRYLAEKPKGTFGKHRYTLEDWGLDADALRERGRPYTEHFGVELE
jgi:hypothetical protein